MTDKVLRKNAYEERLLFKRTEHIEKQKQLTLEEHNFCKSRFLLRFLPIVKRQNELRDELLSKAFDSDDASGEKTIVERSRPVSSYPSAKSRNSAASKVVKPRLRRTVSAELTFPALQENMDDILNGYRTSKTQPNSVSPTKMRFRGKWDLEPRKNDSPVQNETSLPKKISPERKTRSKGVGFRISEDESVENTEHLPNTLTFDYPKISKGKAIERFATVSVNENSTENSLNFVAEDSDRIIQQETITEAAAEKPPRKHSTKSVKISNGDSGGVNDDNSNSFAKQLKIIQNDNKLPEKLLKDLIHTLKSDTSASNTAHFLAKLLNRERDSNLSCGKENPGSLVSLHLGNTNGFHLLSDVKKRQRHEAQRLRIMRTIVLAYDSVWNERLKKISTAA